MLIVYQSLNSGNQKIGTTSAHTSALDSRFTRDAHTSYAQQFHMWDPRSSVQPVLSVDGFYPRATPVVARSSGMLVSRSTHKTPKEAGIGDNRELVGRVVEHILTELKSHGYREPDVIVLGEVHLESTGREDYVVWYPYDNKLACQSFTVLIRTRTQSNYGMALAMSTSTPSYPIMTLSKRMVPSVRIAFVHIPNKYIRDTKAVAEFLEDANANADIIMGDTNLKSYEKLKEVGLKIWGRTTSTFPIDGADTATLHPGRQGYGTSSSEDSLYDRGISRLPGSNFNESMVDHTVGIQGPQPAYQFLGVLSKRILVGQKAVTFSDHNGLVISVLEPSIPEDMEQVKPATVSMKKPLVWGLGISLAVLFTLFVMWMSLWRKNLAEAERKWLSALTNKPDYDFLKELLRVNTGHVREQIAAMAEAVRLPELPSTARGARGTVTLIPEYDHLQEHAANIAELIATMQAKARGRNEWEVILLERQNGAANLGMRDVVLLAELLRESKAKLSSLRIPEEILASPIYHDAVLFNVARQHGVLATGFDGDGGAEPSSPRANDAARETQMAERIRELLAMGYNVTALMGAAHLSYLQRCTRDAA